MALSSPKSSSILQQPQQNSNQQISFDEAFYHLRKATPADDDLISLKSHLRTRSISSRTSRFESLSRCHRKKSVMSAMSAEKNQSDLVVRQINPHVTTLSKPFTAFGAMKVGGRATLVRLTSGAVAVFSPVSLTDEIKNVVSDMGSLKYIIAINMEHYLFVPEWHQAYPSALLIGPPGLQEKRFTPQPCSPTLKFDVVFRPNQQNSVSPEFDADFDSTLISAHFNQELVFNFRPTKTLIEGDLWFNLPAIEQYSQSDDSAETGAVTKLVTWMHKSRGDSLTRKMMWLIFSQGKGKEFGEQVRVVGKWDFDQIVPCHGETVLSGGRQIYRHVMFRFRPSSS